ncbi:MAG: class I SAM-dependent methyltransferase [Myxococcota bacterium]|nr:class I SAM-dependent methyltransferase [Myxococcota bacterium]
MRAWIYDTIFHPLSKKWYRNILSSLPEGSRVLDVGVGTGSSLISNSDLIIKRKMNVMGIDIDPQYLKACRKRIEEENLSQYINVREQSVYTLDQNEKYDAVYFSASFMLLPDQKKALEVIKSCLDAGGLVCFTQTFEAKKTRFWEFVKPLLVRFTTIHFGEVTYEKPFLSLLEDSGFEIVKNDLLMKKGSNRHMKAIMAKVA